MAVYIEANYSKKLGLPQFSSHQYSVTIRTELSDVSQLEKASADLYTQLQQAVDTQIAHQGFIPGNSAASPTTKPTAPVSTPTRSTPTTVPPSSPSTSEDGEVWCCSDRQRDLILKIVNDHRLDKMVVENLARERFGAGVLDLNKAQASGLIDELIETYGKSRNQSDRHGNGRPAFQGRSRR